MPHEMGASLLRIAATRRFQRRDFVGGEEMSKMQWALLVTNSWELRRAYAMAHWASLRGYRAGGMQAGLGVVEAAERAAEALIIGAELRPAVVRSMHAWLGAYVKAGGRLTASLGGRHPKTESFLDDADIKEEAMSWLRREVQASRAKLTPGAHPIPPLTVPRFHKWVNEELLKEIVNPPRWQGSALLFGPVKLRRPIDESTACRWLNTLGFNYRSHKKMIFFDGHERADVVADRAEKLVMLEVLKEVR
jgi:hypothetical protein